MDGQIGRFSLVNDTDLITVLRGSERVVMGRNVTSDDLRKGHRLRFRLQVTDLGLRDIRRKGYMTLSIHVLATPEVRAGGGVASLHLLMGGLRYFGLCLCD